MKKRRRRRHRRRTKSSRKRRRTTKRSRRRRRRKRRRRNSYHLSGKKIKIYLSYFYASSRGETEIMGTGKENGEQGVDSAKCITVLCETIQ